jgi:hypothetical protein
MRRFAVVAAQQLIVRPDTITQLELNDITLRSTENDTWMYVFVRWAQNMGIEISIFRPDILRPAMV